MSTIESVAKSASYPESDSESVIESDSKSNSASDADYNSDPASQFPVRLRVDTDSTPMPSKGARF